MKVILQVCPHCRANQVYFVTRLSPTDERKKTWLFTDVYHKSDECYVAKKDNENSDMFTGTLKGVKVAGHMGSIDITMTKYLYPDAEIQELDNTPNMLLAVKNGKADLACMNAVSAAMSVAANDDLVVVDKLTWEPTDEFDKGCGLCMAYGNEDFANWCNGFFSDIKAEGLWDQMQSDAAAELDAKALEDFIAQQFCYTISLFRSVVFSYSRGPGSFPWVAFFKLLLMHLANRK